MKKLLAICSVFFSVCAAFTSCGDMDDRSDVDIDHGIQIPSTEEEYESNYEHHEDTTSRNKIKDAGDYADDVIDGVEDAGEDIIDGAGDAAKDVIDGVDGEKSDKHENEHRTSTTAR